MGCLCSLQLLSSLTATQFHRILPLSLNLIQVGEEIKLIAVLA
jgi:hypothetical protein